MSYEDWKQYRLKDLQCNFLSGFAFKSADYTEAGIPVVKIGNIQDRTVDISLSVDHVPESLITEKTKRFLLKNKDVLIAMTGQGSVGRVGRICIESDKLAFLNQRVGKFICDEKNLNQDYLFYILASKPYQELLFSNGSGSGQPNLSPETILNTKIPWVNYSIQRRIGNILSSLDDKIELNRQTNQTLEAIAQALFKEWFVDFNFPGATGEMVDSELGEIPKGWEIVALAEIVTIKHGYAFKGENFSDTETNDILLTPGNFKIGGGFNYSKFKYHEGSFPDEYILTRGDVVVTMTDLSKEGDTLGYSALVPEIIGKRLLHNQRIGKVLFKQEELEFYIYVLLQQDAYRNFILGGATGSTVRHTSPSIICEFKVAFPPTKVLKMYKQSVKPLFDSIELNHQQVNTLTKLRDSLLPKLMKGEIEIKL